MVNPNPAKPWRKEPCSAFLSPKEEKTLLFLQLNIRSRKSFQDTAQRDWEIKMTARSLGVEFDS